jgi:hypothetical protein
VLWQAKPLELKEYARQADGYELTSHKQTGSLTSRWLWVANKPQRHWNLLSRLLQHDCAIKDLLKLPSGYRSSN